jgi:hypothetical protein
VRLTIALLGFVAGVQVAAMLAQGAHGLTEIAVHSIVVVPTAGFAIALWRGLRMRIGIIAFALLWSALSIWAVVAITRTVEEMRAAMPDLVVKSISPWFAPLVTARAIFFTATAIVLVTGRPSRRRRIAGASLGAVFAVLFVIEHAYQIFR